MDAYKQIKEPFVAIHYNLHNNIVSTTFVVVVIIYKMSKRL